MQQFRHDDDVLSLLLMMKLSNMEQRAFKSEKLFSRLMMSLATFLAVYIYIFRTLRLWDKSKKLISQHTAAIDFFPHFVSRAPGEIINCSEHIQHMRKWTFISTILCSSFSFIKTVSEAAETICLLMNENKKCLCNKKFTMLLSADCAPDLNVHICAHSFPCHYIIDCAFSA